jgi:ribosome-associated protein
VPIKKKAGLIKAKTKKNTGGEGAPSTAKAKRSVTSKATDTAHSDPGAAGGKPRSAGRRERSATVPDKVKAATARAASLKAVVINALDDMKALEVKVLDVRGLTDVADTMVIASGTSDRHVRSVAKNVVEKTKAAGFRPHGVEGQQDSDWVLIDLSEMIVHVMLPRVREFYGLEKLWDMTTTKRAARA